MAIQLLDSSDANIRATQFKTVVLDCEGVAMVGQGFVDEVFRVFGTAQPQVTLKPVNVNPAVAQALRMFAPWVGVKGVRLLPTHLSLSPAMSKAVTQRSKTNQSNR